MNWVTVFDKNADFGGAPLSECNIIELDRETLRVYAVNLKNLKYYFKDVDKKTLSVGDLREVKFRPSSDADTRPYLFEFRGELHPTEGLMFGWSQGKDCLNYTVLHTVEPRLVFKNK